jgi:crotonobetainyl-CoA:carnitine CoA-transferase CaiB-like acyl-CoA transferase
MMNPPAKGPLKGLKILDLSRMLPGPYCTLLLADFGADVIMIEQGSGSGLGKRRTDFYIFRNKRSIVLDLKNIRGRAVFYRLAATADVIVEGFRPGVAERLEIDYHTVQRINRRIIYCSISGFGQDGPYRDRVGHDINYVALAGLLSVTGKKGQGPSILGTQVGDIGGGIFGAFSILVAVLAREKTGEGQYIDVSMMDSAIALNPVSFFEYFLKGEVFEQGGYRLLGSVPCYNTYQTKDGKYISIGALEPKFWATFCYKVNRPDLIKKQNDESKRIVDEVQKIFLSKTQAEWNELLGSEDVCYAPVLNLQETCDDPQVCHRHMIIDNHTLGKTRIKQIGIAPKFSITPGKIRRPAPDPGQDTEEILIEIGLQSPEIFELKSEGVIKGVSPEAL